MLDAAARAGVTLFVAENQAYEPDVLRLREIVRTGEHIGELTFAAVVAGYRAPDPRYPGRRAWLTDPSAGGTGTWTLQGIHTVARLRAVLGEVESVFVLDHRARSFSRPDLEATMSGVLVLESGLVVWIVQTTETALPGRLAGFRLHGDAGSVIAWGDGYEVQPNTRDAAPTTHAYPSAGLSSYALELRAFAEALGRDGRGLTDGASERRSLAVVEAGRESARTGQPVRLRSRFPELVPRIPIRG
jgi:predicted dehydrogenase